MKAHYLILSSSLALLLGACNQSDVMDEVNEVAERTMESRSIETSGFQNFTRTTRPGYTLAEGDITYPMDAEYTFMVAAGGTKGTSGYISIGNKTEYFNTSLQKQYTYKLTGKTHCAVMVQTSGGNQNIYARLVITHINGEQPYFGANYSDLTAQASQ